MAKGVLGGIAGVFLDPISGAMQDGARGFAKGALRGIAGAALRPISGVASGVSLITQGTHGLVKSAMSVSAGIAGGSGGGAPGSGTEELSSMARVRFPRALHTALPAAAAAGAAASASMSPPSLPLPAVSFVVPYNAGEAALLDKLRELARGSHSYLSPMLAEPLLSTERLADGTALVLTVSHLLHISSALRPLAVRSLREVPLERLSQSGRTVTVGASSGGTGSGGSAEVQLAAVSIPAAARLLSLLSGAVRSAKSRK